MDKRIRITIQAVATLLANANFKGFFTGKIYKGPVKNVCVPGLNCYSCPGAVGACPIGSLQNSLSAYKFKFPYYVLGLLIFFGAIFGRLICGLLCPFGFLQDLLNLIPFPKKIKTFKGDRILRKLKYVVLAVMVITLPIIFKMTPVFCKYLCPEGTLSGLLLMTGNPELLSTVGPLFIWKVFVLALTVIAAILIFRPFCKYLCPLGAFYSLFNKVSLIQLHVDEHKCSACGACARKCNMNVNPATECNHAECIRCGECIKACPESAIKFGTVFKK